MKYVVMLNVQHRQKWYPDPKIAIYQGRGGYLNLTKPKIFMMKNENVLLDPNSEALWGGRQCRVLRQQDSLE